VIRQATENDADAITTIYNYYIINSTATFEESAITSVDIIDRMGKVKAAGLPWLVVEKDSQLAGFAYASTWNDRSAYRHTVQVTIYLSSQMTSSGIGSALYSELFSQLKQSDIHVAIGVITLPNLASVAIHEKLGMKKAGHFEQVGYKFGEWLDVGYWQLKLNS
jgi:phosphinothricin acetyltransferase